MTLREQLLELTEPKYMKFTSALMLSLIHI